MQISKTQIQNENEIFKYVQPQDVVKFGLIPEFVGRIPVISSLDKLDRDALVSILTKPKNAIIKQYQKLVKKDKVELEFLPEALEAIADEAIKRGTGARGLRAIVEEIMLDVMYEIPSRKDIEKIIITKDDVNKGIALPETSVSDEKPKKTRKRTRKKDA